MSEIRHVFKYDPERNGIYEFPIRIQESPREPGVWLDQIPFTTPIEPLPQQEGFTVNFINEKWEYIEIPPELEED